MTTIDHRHMSYTTCIALLLLVSSFCLPAVADPKDDETTSRKRTDSPTQHEIPPFDAMLRIALRQHPDVRLAESELQSAVARRDQVRLNVAKEIREFHDQLESELAAIAEAEVEIRESERVINLHNSNPEAIAEKAAQAARNQLQISQLLVSTARARCGHLRAVLPLLLGTSEATKRDKNDKSAGTRDADHENAEPTQREDGDLPDRVREKLTERLHVLVQISELLHTSYKLGEVRLDAVLAAETDATRAELELAATAKERVQIRKRLVKTATQLEAFIQQLVEANEAGVTDMLKARALRMRAEANLMSEH